MASTRFLRDSLVRKARNLTARGRLLIGRATAGGRLLPDFLIIGAQKGGTTSLYAYLLQHPDVAASIRKEVHFFNDHYHNGLRWYRSHFPLIATKLRHVKTTGRNLITGEATPYYLYHPSTPARVRDALPHVKLIVLFRDPVTRAFSHYNHSYTRGAEDLSFEDALAEEGKRLESERNRIARDPAYKAISHRMHSYVDRGYYARQLKVWFDVFDRSRFLFLKSEDLYRKPEYTLERTRAFIGLSACEWQIAGIFNKGSYRATMRLETRDALRELFRPANEELNELLGETFDWGY